MEPFSIPGLWNILEITPPSTDLSTPSPALPTYMIHPSRIPLTSPFTQFSPSIDLQYLFCSLSEKDSTIFPCSPLLFGTSRQTQTLMRKLWRLWLSHS